MYRLVSVQFFVCSVYTSSAILTTYSHTLFIWNYFSAWRRCCCVGAIVLLWDVISESNARAFNFARLRKLTLSVWLSSVGNEEGLFTCRASTFSQTSFQKSYQHDKTEKKPPSLLTVRNQRENIKWSKRAFAIDSQINLIPTQRDEWNNSDAMRTK